MGWWSRPSTELGLAHPVLRSMLPLWKMVSGQQDEENEEKTVRHNLGEYGRKRGGTVRKKFKDPKGKHENNSQMQ